MFFLHYGTNSWKSRGGMFFDILKKSQESKFQNLWVTFVFKKNIKKHISENLEGPFCLGVHPSLNWYSCSYT